MTTIATSTDLAAALPHARPKSCPVCGGQAFAQQDVLWPDLIRAWGLDPSEVLLINEQQGYTCTGCSANLRSMTLAAALLDLLDFSGSLEQWVKSGKSDRLRLLEINPAGQLHACLSRVPTCLCLAYPQADMQALDLADASFDLVLHSDTLEHIPDPVKALRECRRVLRPHGRMLMTIPIVPTRLTRRCDGLPPSYHGNAQEHPADFRVRTEYGADFFLDMLLAGWTKISLFSLGSAASLAVTGVK